MSIADTHVVQCIYAVTKTVVFEVDNPHLSFDDKVATVIFRQLSYFSDKTGIEGLLEYLGHDSSMREVFEAVEKSTRDVPKSPLLQWSRPWLDDDFKDLITRLTKLDPRQRITARVALTHQWFWDA